MALEVVVDDREARAGIVELLGRQVGVEVVVRRLEVGDFLLGNRVLVERKTLLDFARSIVDGRLFDQASRLSESGLRVGFLIEGRARDLEGCGMRREVFQGALVTLSLIFNIPVFRSLDTKESARLLVYISDQLKRVGTNFRVEDQRTPRSLKGRRLRLLRTLPGIGRSKAKMLLDEFGSVENCVNASVCELMTLPGIGRKTAESIREMVEETCSGYGKRVDDDL